jgi:hypothetical protein
MRVPILARNGVLTILTASSMAFLAATAADPAAARVTGAGAAPASSGGAQQWVSHG